MKVYTYSQAREKFADILEESKKEEIVIRRRKGDMFTIAPKTPTRRSPFDVAGLAKTVSRKEIVSAIRASRERLPRSAGGGEKRIGARDRGSGGRVGGRGARALEKAKKRPDEQQLIRPFLIFLK